MTQADNPDRKIAIACLLICIAAAAGAVMPSLVGMDMMQSGYALTCLTGFFVLSALVATLVFWTRASAWDRLAQGQDVLAHWTDA